MIMDQKVWEVMKKVDSCLDGLELFRIVKQMTGKKKDVFGVSCLKDESGAVKVSVDDRKKIWKEQASGVAIEMCKAGGDKCLKSLANIFNDILFKDKLPEEWMLSSLLPIFKGKGDPFNPN